MVIELVTCDTLCDALKNALTFQVTGNRISLICNGTEITSVDLCVPALSLEKSASPASVAVGGTVTYTIVVRNTGCAVSSPVTVTDTLPNCLQPVGPELTCTQPLQRVHWNNSSLWDTANPTWTAALESLLESGTAISFADIQNIGAGATFQATNVSGLLDLIFNDNADAIQMRLAPNGGRSTVRWAFDRPVCYEVSTMIDSGVPLTITSDQPVTLTHNTSNPANAGVAPTITGNGTTAVTVTSASNSRVLISGVGEWVDFTHTNNRAAAAYQWLGLSVALATETAGSQTGGDTRGIDGQTMTWTINQINPGSSATLTYQATAQCAGSITNAAIATGPGGPATAVATVQVV